MLIDLFNDRTTLPSEFITADVLDDHSDLVNRFTGQFDIINAMSFFYLFDWDAQVVVVKRIVSLLCLRPGSLLVGRHVGCIRPCKGPDGGVLGYCHNEETWKKLWEIVSKETGTKWKVDVVSDPWGSAPNPTIMKMVNEQGMIKVRFEVRRE